ncbi:MAG: hypothetical protein IT371_00630 [Deltaproteobacteria bacterium]|nr:hypothetical protein [Deltaproteobacteria bacterium]
MRWMLRAGLLALVCLAGLDRAWAVPAFARRYGTSCQTCHVAFPKLTPFGEAFRRRAHHFPGGQDEDYRKKEQQKLGADGYKAVFPRSVWPGELPAEIPISAFVTSTVRGAPEGPQRASFAAVGGSVALNGTATLGSWVSAWFGIAFLAGTGETAQVSLERAFVAIAPFKRPWAVLRVGRFEPAIFSFSSHRMLGLAPWILTAPVRDNQFALEPTQLGFEVAGIALRGRGSYALGFVEGAGNQLNAPKDLYGRVAYKIGGMRPDGDVGTAELNLADPAPWREWSVQLGGFGYFGWAEIGNPESASQDDRFWLAGGDVSAQLRDVSVTAAYSQARHRRPILAEPTRSLTVHQLMGQVDYVLFPWLIPTVRYERRMLDGGAEDRLTPGVYLLVRANIRVVVLANVQRPIDGRFALERVQGSLALGF